MKKRIKVALNGLEYNPYSRFGLTQNPFPQTAKAEWDEACLRMQSLGGCPIPDVAHIRKTLEGYSTEFIDLCCNQFQPGQYVIFDVEFPWEEHE